jgi:hypothetical protein
MVQWFNSPFEGGWGDVTGTGYRVQGAKDKTNY